MNPLISIMSVDVFGRTLLNGRIHTVGKKGPPGDGFKRTSDGNYSIEGKRLSNLADPLDNFDAVSLHVLRKQLTEEVSALKQILEFQSKLINESIPSRLDKIEGKLAVQERRIEQFNTSFNGFEKGDNSGRAASTGTTKLYKASR